MTQNKNNYICIMAGGVGSRFWPASREARPKQFLDILGVGKSLIQLTYERAIDMVPKENILILTNTKYKKLVIEQLGILPNQILMEPSRNNTAPCIAYATLKINAMNPDAVFAVWPSDHIIIKENVFQEKMKVAFSYAKEYSALVTLGIKPTRPDTGYGYIEVNHMDGAQAIERVVQFKEKPDIGTAQKYLDAGNFFWNAGIFIWSVQAVMEAFEKNEPSIIEVLNAQPEKYNTPEEQAYIDKVYPNTKSISVDYALLERSDNVYVIESDFGWSDLGTWGSLHDECEKDEEGNVTNSEHFYVENTKNCLIRVPKDKLVVIKDLEDFIVVDEDDVLLIHPKSKEQEIKTITNSIRDKDQSGHFL